MFRYRTLFASLLAAPFALGEPLADRLDWVSDPAGYPLCVGYYLSPALPEAGPEIEARADASTYDGTDRIVLEGNAALWNQQISLEADDISLFRVSGDGDAIGNVALREPRFLVRGNAASLNLYTGRVELYGSEIVAHGLHVYGSAESVTRDGSGVLRVRDALYTKCAPGENAWQLGSDYMKLDRNTGRGFARNVTLRAKGVPVFWFPIIGFPVDERRLTGFLWPTIKSESNATDGDDWSIEAPFYWNQAPQADMQITPRRLAFRGNGLDLEQRYLFNNESTLSARVGLLPDDDKTKTDREAAELQWSSKPGQATIASAEAAYASDDEYDSEIAGIVGLGNDDYPAVQANLSHRSERGTLSGKLYTYTVADKDATLSQHPYRELPRINYTLAGDWNDSSEWSTRTELVRFDRDITGLSGETAVLGSRLLTQLQSSLPLRRTWGYATARVGVDAVTYQLDRASDDAQDATPGAVVPRASLDMGLNIAKDYGTQTHRIEPRIKYLIAGHDDQTDQPNFDTGAIGFSFTQLFSERRFSGGDRIGDTEQVTLGLSNKVIRDADGRERIRVDFGQTFYLKDRKTNLTDSLATDDRSPLVSEARVAFSENFSGNAEATLRDDMGIDSGALAIKYRGSSDTLATLRTRFSDDTVTTYEASALYGINERWRVGGGFAFSRPLDRTQRFAWGFEYESCCWRASLVQSYDRPDTSTSAGTHALTLQVQLKGLGMVGRKAITHLEDNIEDFEPRPIRF